MSKEQDVNAALLRLQGEVDRLTRARLAQAEARLLAANDEVAARSADCLRLERALAASQASERELREALYPLVVGCLTADANEDAPEFVNDEAYVGRRALPECVRCCGSGSTDGTEYVDVAIPEALRCPDCGGWGFLKHPRCGGWGFLKHPRAPGSTEALRTVLERLFQATLEATRSHCACDAEKSWSRDEIIARVLDRSDTTEGGRG